MPIINEIITKNMCFLQANKQNFNLVGDMERIKCK